MLPEVLFILAEYVTIGTIVRLRRISKLFRSTIDNDRSIKMHFGNLTSMDPSLVPLWDFFEAGHDPDKCMECGIMTDDFYPKTVRVDSFRFPCCSRCLRDGFRRVEDIDYDYWRLNLPYRVIIDDHAKEFFFVNREYVGIGHTPEFYGGWCKYPLIEESRAFHIYNDYTSPRTSVQLMHIKHRVCQLHMDLVEYMQRFDFASR